MSETFEEDNNLNINTVESENMQIDTILEGMQSKIVITEENCREIDNKKKMLSKNIQVDLKVLPDEIVLNMKNENYWQDLAEVKRIELEVALEENERLQKLKENLIQENIGYMKLLLETNNFVQDVKEVVNESPDDTGIDVRDVDDSQNE